MGLKRFYISFAKQYLKGVMGVRLKLPYQDWLTFLLVYTKKLEKYSSNVILEVAMIGSYGKKSKLTWRNDTIIHDE